MVRMRDTTGIQRMSGLRRNLAQDMQNPGDRRMTGIHTVFGAVTTGGMIAKMSVGTCVVTTGGIADGILDIDKKTDLKFLLDSGVQHSLPLDPPRKNVLGSPRLGGKLDSLVAEKTTSTSGTQTDATITIITGTTIGPRIQRRRIKISATTSNNKCGRRNLVVVQ